MKSWSAWALAALATSAAGAAIDDCLAAASVPVDAKGGNDWNADVAPFNTRLQYTPAAIVVPKTIADIQAAVKCAAANKIKVSPKGGGHSYASFGLGGENGHLVIELDRLNKVTVNSTTKVATIQAGARLGHVFTELYKQGQRAISHGTCPGVGLAGHSLHGGFGFSSHTHGLALDWMVGATVVLANATVVNCSATENADLFWALRGAGSSFGVVHTFYFNTFAAPPQTTAFQVNLPWSSAGDCANGWSALQDWLSAGSMPAELNFRIFGSSYQTQIQGLYHGGQAALQTAMQPLLGKLGASLSQVQQTDWVGGFAAYDNGDTVDASHPYNQHENFFSKSMATTALPARALQAVCGYWMNQARSNTRSWYIIIDMMGGKNAFIPSVASNATSFAHRDKLFLYELYDRAIFGSFPSNGFSFLNGWADSFTQNLAANQWGMYINYADPTMNRTYANQVYYGSSLPRLQQIKAAVDPTQVFDYPQAIAPAK
ncbi:chitooligosaccharide oxidase [Sporothrix brasiliensis 5110]|uniref:Chitooligosaccharide oxidase n=1 Tax=Sporothrix brasiliensis 5110 TaxID=1398154 RepID=A0A0C2EX61_9PEZI|nr:chitooligosaccharide oxidase [Sporothrix brasiliensis 5110]KIH91154.1 chitooligosaccharide oxidase [Sporothrix brasiliensis 5110]